MQGKMVGLFAAVMIALMVAGISYGMWSKTLYINGTMSTGTVDAKFTLVASNDPSDSLDPSECGTWTLTDNELVWNGERYDKDVATTTVQGADTDTLSVSVSNAYPCYYAGVGFTIDNVGSIPVKIKSIELIKVSFGEVVIPVEYSLTACTTCYVHIYFDEEELVWKAEVSDTLIEGAQFTIHISKLAVGDQIDDGESKLGDLCVHILQPAKQNASYDFSIRIVVAQWNEV